MDNESLLAPGVRNIRCGCIVGPLAKVAKTILQRFFIELQTKTLTF